jgi:antitoxin ParD1/3/4
MPTRNVNLTDHYDEFVAALVQSGQYKNASEVMRAGLHLLELQALAEAEKLNVLRKLADEGFKDLDQGRGLFLTGDDALVAAIEKIGDRASRSVRRATKAQ